MKRVGYGIGKLALTLTLAVSALLLSSSPVRAGQGHGGGHAGSGVSGHTGHHVRHYNVGGYGWGWGGYYPYWGYDAPYAGAYGYGIYDGSNPYLGVITPYSFGPPAAPYTNYNFINAIDFFQ